MILPNDLASNVVETCARFRAEVLRLINEHYPYFSHRPLDEARLSSWLRSACDCEVDMDTQPLLLFFPDDAKFKTIIVPSDFDGEGFAWKAQVEAYIEIMRLLGVDVKAQGLWEVHVNFKTHSVSLSQTHSATDATLSLTGNHDSLEAKEQEARELANALNRSILRDYGRVVH